MWDSAKKPIKVRSILQPNGMRHFIVNEDNEEVPAKPVPPQRKSSNNKILRSSGPLENSTGQEKCTGVGNGTCTDDYNERNYHCNTSTYPSIIRSNTLNDMEGRWESSISQENEEHFFGVAGSQIYNSKKLKGHHPRYFHQFPHATKSKVEFTRYPTLRADVLDLVPVKSPVIKKLINGRIHGSDSYDERNGTLKNQKCGATGYLPNGVPSTTLCSRIMTWIDLEVKRNAGKGKSSASLSFNSADLSIVNELLMSGESGKNNLGSSSASDTSSGSASSLSGDGASTSSCVSSSSSGGSSCSNSVISLPKLIPCWRKEGNLLGNNKTKKSVRIADDLPRWGKMKRRLRRKTSSLNELYEEEPLVSLSTRQPRSSYKYERSKTDYCGKLIGRKEYSSVPDLLENTSDLRAGGSNGKITGECKDKEPKEKEMDSFIVCDESLLPSGKLQVHIFLPQTDRSAGGRSENVGNLSGRSEDSTS